ncbi:LOW QUALITY PROTEIN: protein pitchfork [Hirundo rustica]|uniref:LOW QUALITY PROTEIN: protein pitchfork n=1 Tax=Hirundo rustica TaxID=43150 RepID=UPI001A94E397|nr:LOW QUALITY PROTEIN: protein pitchfork [Hirundo rustica]
MTAAQCRGKMRNDESWEEWTVGGGSVMESSWEETLLSPHKTSPGTRAVKKQISFGTTQERKMFPYYFAPDRLGVEIPGVRGNPLLGPGCYLRPEANIFKSSISTRPMSSRGYVLGARTAPRFQPKARTVTPGPAAYQPFLGDERRCQPAYVPFSSSSPRFPTRLLHKDLFPGPGTYNIEQPSNRRVTWPMKFGAPDWDAVAAPPKRMVKMQVQKMTMDKNFQKNQGREAYLKLYHS